MDKETSNTETVATVKPAGEMPANLTVDQLARQISDDRRSRRAPVSEQPVVNATTEDAAQPNLPAEAAESDPEQVETNEAPEETQGDAVADSGTDADSDEDAAAMAEIEAEPDMAKRFQKLKNRMHKAIRQKNELSDKVKQLESAPKEQPSQSEIEGPDDDPELSQINGNIERLDQAIQTLEGSVETGMMVKLKDGREVELNPDQCRKKIKEYADMRTRLITHQEMRSAQLQQERVAIAAESRAAAVKHYPWINDEKSPSFQLAMEELKLLGSLGRSLRSNPRFPIIMARYVAGLQAEQNAGKTKPATPKALLKPGSNTPPPSLPVTTSIVPRKSNELDTQLKEAQDRFAKSGKAQDLARVEELKEQRARASTLR